MEHNVPTVVLIDDSVEVRTLVKARLRVSGEFDVVADGGTGTEAIGLAYLHQPALLLLDMSMPGMDGLDALPGVLAVSPNTRVVAYTGFEELALADTAKALGAAALIRKSLPIDQLTGELSSILERPAGKAVDTRPRRRRIAMVRGSTRLPRGDDGDREDQGILDEHLESFREVFDQAAIGMATLTLGGNIVRANVALADLMNCRPAELVGVDYGRLMSGGSDELDAALLSIGDHWTDLVQLHHDVVGWPSPRRALATLAAVRDSKGRALYAFLQVQDVTAQGAAEEHLRRSEERFRLLVEAVEEYAIFMLDPDGLVASWNSGAQRIKGYSSDEIVGQHFRVFYPAEKQAEGHPEFELAEAVREGRYEEEGWRVRKDGSRFWASVLITAISDDDGRHVGFAKVTRDATERRRAEQQHADTSLALAEANSELEAANVQLAQAAEEQANFLAVAAHELRSPLTVVAGSASTLARYLDELSPAEVDGLVNGMTASANRVQRLLSDLLTIARIEAHAMSQQPARIELGSLLTGLVDSARALNPGVELVVDIRADLVVLVDADRLRQAVDNVLVNALRHGLPPVRVIAEEERGQAAIRVADMGEGVDGMIAPQLFERFATADRQQGTGLGLYITRELVRAQGGEARYDKPSDEYPSGAFVLTVPIA